MTTREKIQDLALGAAAVILAAVMLLGCAAGKNKVLSALDAARDGFADWDLTHQRDLVDQTSGGAETDAALLAYRSKRDGVILAFLDAYAALAQLLSEPTEANGKLLSGKVTALMSRLAALQGVKPTFTPRPRAVAPAPVAP